ncbi:MAG TPA: hypothetical protein VG458_08540 [Solirubrobacterales bacterium]|nr:hypothetical protein [Solirubrobacterales bacterium]
MRGSSQVAQIAGSLLVALMIAAIAIWAVTEHFGPTSVAKLEAQEERIDSREDAAKAREEAAEERREGNPSGPG